jgi:hypothetical protein
MALLSLDRIPLAPMEAIRLAGFTTKPVIHRGMGSILNEATGKVKNYFGKFVNKSKIIF